MNRKSIRRMNAIASTSLISALLCFTGFHAFIFARHPPDFPLPEMRGWEIWQDLAFVIRNRNFNNWVVSIAWASFLCASLLIVASPFLIPVFRVSRLAWWLAVSCSAVSLVGLGGVVVLQIGTRTPAPGFYCLLLALGLNTLGLLFIRRNKNLGPADQAEPPS